MVSSTEFLEYLDDNQKRNFFFVIQRQLLPKSVSEYMRKIGLSESDYHYSSTSKHSDDHRPYKMLDRWTQRCGLFTEDMKKFLEGVLQEVSTGQRSLELDTFLPSINCHTIQNNRDLAWLLYDVANHYFLEDVWHREIVIEKLNIPNSIIERLRSDVPNDILERQYCILKKWMQRNGVSTAREVQDRFRQLGIHVPNPQNDEHPPLQAAADTEDDAPIPATSDNPEPDLT